MYFVSGLNTKGDGLQFLGALSVCVQGLHGDLGNGEQGKSPHTLNTWEAQLFPQHISVHRRGQYCFYYKDEDTRSPVGECPYVMQPAGEGPQ